jgi:hypothetical protein
MIIQSLYNEDDKKKKPSQVAADQNKSQSARVIQPIYAADDKFQYVAPKATPQPQQQTGFFQSAIDAIKKTAQTAINALTQKSGDSGIKFESASSQSPSKPSQAVSNLKLDLGTNQAAPSAQPTVTPQSIEQQKRGVQKIDTFYKPIDNVIDTVSNVNSYAPQASSVLHELAIDPLSLKADPKKAINDAWEAIKSPVMDFLKTKQTILTQPPKSLAEDIGRNLHLTAAGAGVVFSPLSALFAAANDVPVLGSLSRLITLPFTAVGEGSTSLSNGIVDQLPISKEAKDQIKPGLGEIAALVSQIALGKVTQVGAKKHTDLVKKYGEKDAATIETKAKEIANQKNQSNQNNGIEMTPDQARVQAEATDLKGTKAGEVLINAADQAEKQGKNLLISAPQEQKLLSAPKQNASQGEGFTVTDKVNKEAIKVTKSTAEYQKALDDYNKAPTPEKLKKVQELKQSASEAKAAFSAKTDKGNEFTIDFVEPRKLELISEEGGNASQIPGQIISNGVIPPIEKLSSPIEKPVTESFKPKDASKTPSKIAESIETKAIEQKLTEGFEGLAGYDKITIKEQAQKASELLTDIEKTRRVIRGEEELPTGLRGTAVITAAEEYIKKTGDAKLAYDLANSHLVSETSAAAQELRLAAERQPDSLAQKLKDLKQTREEAVRKKTGKTLDKAIKSEVDTIKSEVRKSAPKKEDWSSFLDSIQC